MNTYELTAPARLDLAAIQLYISRFSEARADKMCDRILSRCELLAGQPLLGTDCSHKYRSMRFLTVKPYVIYYRPVESGIRVMRILHGAQDADAELR